MKSPNSADAWVCPPFSLSPAGLAALDVERLGRLHLELAENAGERELSSTSRGAVPEYDVKAPRRVLERCHYRHADPMPLSGGVHKGNIVLLTRFPERQATAAASKGPSSSSAASWIPSPKPDSATSVFFTGKGGQPCRASTFWILPRHPDHHGEPGGNARRHPEARPLASNVLREAGLEELYSPCNAHHLVEQALCPDAGDGDILRPEVFSGNLADA